MKKVFVLVLAMMMLSSTALAANLVEINLADATSVYMKGDVTVAYTLNVKDTSSEGGVGLYTSQGEGGNQRYNFKVRDTFGDGRIDYYVAKDYANAFTGFLISEEYQANGWTKDCFVSVDEGWAANTTEESVTMTIAISNGKATVTMRGNTTGTTGTLTFDLNDPAWLGDYKPATELFTEGYLSFDGNVDNITNIFIDQDTWNANFYVAPADVVGYINNTVCVLGPSLRDFQDAATGKWYTVLPVDLTQDGTYTYPLIGGNCYEIGEVTVIVRNGMVNTSYKYFSGAVAHYPTEGISEYINYFTNWEDITAEAVESQPESGYEFGKTYVAKRDFDGAEQVYLFICNRASFYGGADGNPHIYRYYKEAYKPVINAIVEAAGLADLYTK